MELVKESARTAQRFRLLLDQLAEEGKSQVEIGRLLGVSESVISKIKSGERGAGASTIQHVIDFFGLSADFFYAPQEPGHYSTLLREKRRVEPAIEDTEGWREFVRLGLLEHYRTKLTAEQLEWVRTAPARGKGQGRASWYRDLCEVLVTGGQPSLAFEATADDDGPDASRLTKTSRGKQ